MIGIITSSNTHGGVKADEKSYTGFTCKRNHAMFQKRWADHDYHEEGGESLAMVQERNIEALNEILSENIDKEVVIGTHGTALSTILNWISRAISWLVSRSTAICLTDLA